MTGRKVICAFEVLAGMTRMVVKFRRWATDRPLLLPDGIGTGPVPSRHEADVEMLDAQAFSTLTEQVRARMRPASRLTPAVAAAVERYDPARSAVWWLSPVSPNSALLGRPVLGGRPPSQAALEDKLIVDGMLDQIGAGRSPSVTTLASYDDLMRATDEILACSGASEVVWAGDARDGTNGGGDYVRWIRHSDHAAAGAAFFAANCDRVRVSPFLDGVPCSIHGIVLPDGVVVLRPMELVSLRQADVGRFFYGGMGTSWDPSLADAVDMRSVARALGAHLKQTSGYRGAFGLDGVVTADGFRITELNSRFSGGLTRLANAAPGSQLELVHVNSLIGRDIARSAGDVETQALDLLDDNRFVDVMGMSSTDARETIEVRVRADDSRLEAAGDGCDGIGSVEWGPSGIGSFARLRINGDLVGRGDRCAPLGVLLCEFADRTWDTGFGTVEMPPQARANETGG